MVPLFNNELSVTGRRWKFSHTVIPAVVNHMDDTGKLKRRFILIAEKPSGAWRSEKLWIYEQSA